MTDTKIELGQLISDWFYELLGWSQIEFHQALHDRKAFLRNDPARQSGKSLRELLTREQKERLLRGIMNVWLSHLDDKDFASYLQNKLALQLGCAV